MKHLLLGAAALCAVAGTGAEPKVQTIRFVQDDAQDYMVSKMYELKYLKANDLTPFVLGIVKRYNINSSVNRINDKASNRQLLTVSCPVGMMPSVDEFIAAVDRPSGIAGKEDGDPILGSGITRDVYMPQFRSAQTMVDIMYSIGINSGKSDSLIGYDQNSNQIYWKDGAYKGTDIVKYLGWLDRPVPQVNITFSVYEVRESTLRDLGIDYLAWKNGPGLNLLQAGFDAFSVTSAGSAALQAASGSMGGFFFAPQFDASFVRVLEQDGKAHLVNTANLTVVNSDTKSYRVQFNPQLQNLTKKNNDQSSVDVSAVAGKLDIVPLAMVVTKPVVCLSGAADPKSGQLPYGESDYRDTSGVLVFDYVIQAANVVERNNYGAELIETSRVTGSSSIRLHVEKTVALWSKESEVEQTIGVPWLSEIPYLKYFFGTTTTSRENTWFMVTAQAVPVHPDDRSAEAGTLISMQD